VSRRILPAVVALVVAVGAVLAVRLATAGDALTSAELVAYQAAIHPPLSEGGRLVQERLKPAAPAGTPVAEADGWARELDAIRARVAAVDPPDELAGAHRLFDTALAQYAETARLVADGSGDAVAAGERADATYDDASRILQRERRRLGLGATAEFPDPDA
jgi:hypothetical protein